MNFTKTIISAILLLLSIDSTAGVHQQWEMLSDSLLLNKSQAVIISETDNFLHATVSSALDVQIKVLATEKSDSIVCLSRTYSAPESESVIEIYDKEWNLQRTISFKLSDVIGAENAKIYSSYFEPLLIKATLHDETDEVTLSISDKFLSEEEKKEIKDLNLQTNVKLANILLN